ncbi:dehydrogenase [Aliikangiella sp. G2MR2-5]|uniref:GHMP family kinase ATP-binding protein n=1 Tax=Aliikangiella sp. G2MR2-5 TaxID=2788943 RepID=UPI0018AA0FA9|nr:dehydrogenase [Aliikangiella sp. G2MR2-5]
MKIRSKAPLRLGLAGGGTDVSPYSDEFGGCVLNATINLFANAYIDQEVNGNEVVFEAKDLGIREVIDLRKPFSIEGKLLLHRAVYIRVMRDFNHGHLLPLRIITESDAPPGSGLGSSSTMVVAILEGLKQLLSLPLGEYDVAHLAYQIERNDCSLAGGKQDQYAATFGGFNFIEFYKKDRVIVNPLRIRKNIINELEANLILYYTGKSRHSAKIIDDQMKSIRGENIRRLEAMHNVKKSAFRIKEHLFKANIEELSQEFKLAWEAKKATSSSIANPLINDIENCVLNCGAKSLKISGAGGGGFMMVFVEPERRVEVIQQLKKFGGVIHKFQFTREGAYSWTI